MSRLNFISLLILASVLSPLAPAQSQPTDPRTAVHSALHAKQGIVLAVKPIENPDSEAYGDWADRLNRFATHEGRNFKIILVTKAKFSQIVAEPKITKPYATLFILDHTHALFYDNMILDYSDYELGAAYLKRQNLDDKPMPAYGLHRVTVHLK
jgi:hypothetical protein